jgi:predicted nucleic-acid-binding protein
VPAVDTNVLIRLVTEDDEGQLRFAAAFVRNSGRVFVSHIVLVEAAWVLSSGHGFSRDELARALDIVLATGSFAVERPELVAEALGYFRASRADFSDCLIAATARAANELPLATFDAAAARVPGCRRLGPKASATGTPRPPAPARPRRRRRG